MSHEQDGFDCNKCEKPNSFENMVMCDTCLDWYHLGCAGVTPGIEHRPWHCEKCTPPVPPSIGTSLDKDKRNKKLPAKDAAGSINPENSRKKDGDRRPQGWTIYGPSGMNPDARPFFGIHGHKTIAERELNEMIRQQFVLEDTGISPSPLPESAEITRAREILERTTVREDGRFVTGLLWRNDEICFPDSLPMAIKRLRNLESKLAKNPDLCDNVHRQIQEYIERGYAHKAKRDELQEANPDRVWYLPLNIVTHPKKPEKIRLVWDAAAKVNGVSLNSQLLKGPDLLVQLPGVICKFRERRVGFGGDIEKMFHQIRIKPEDTHSQRFLFRFNTSQQPDVYIMDVATFGATCSPCAAQFVMHRNAEESAIEFPEAALAIKEKTYMDDYFDSADTPEEASERALQVKLIHSRGGFNMRNWVSNSIHVLQSLGVASEQRLLSIDCSKEEKRQRVLGIAWDPEKDVFVFSTSWHSDLTPYVFEDRRPTKRIALRIIMSLFDPLGLLAPFLIHGRMLIQDLWRLGLDWDANVGDKEHEKWRRWISLLPSITELEIPRHYFGSANPSSYGSLQLHVFTDASEMGYGCAAYFRLVCDGQVQCSLIMARSKVAPLKYQSIPRMELQAALLGARMLHTVSDNHSLPIAHKYIHTDSEFGVIRVEGRTVNASYATFDARFPIILPKDHTITTLLLSDYHRQYGHANRETVVNEVRQRFYIFNLRSAIDKVMRSCQRCKLTKCQPQVPRMAPLPEERLTPFIRPFSYVGVDYLGPLETFVGRRREKRYVAVFTCLVTRAIHLEVAHNLSTDSCIMAVRRFVRRRGPPVEIFSDNGTNFVGASNELAKQIKHINSECAETFTDARTKWTFNPPSAPHMGGVWERMVRSVKEAIRALDDGRKLNDEILLTVLAEAEGFINSRPFTYMPQGSADGEAITPNHFLLGRSSGMQDPLRTPVDLASALRSSYQRSQFLSDAVWQRWLKEYFPTLNKRSKWFTDGKPVQVGDLVYVAEGSRRTWVRGQVMQVIVGSDGRVRQAIIRTAGGKELKRPVVKLAVMEVAGSESFTDPKGPHQDPRGGGCSGTTAKLRQDNDNPKNDRQSGLSETS
ncbi:uncharacterized protein LOC134290455 [Aedes albopictus]|uniref:Uncharacterized protein n=1 Tax=Aedes albopictus TaxID=7160 RepID=A0ABM1Y3V9_AEDAL